MRLPQRILTGVGLPLVVVAAVVATALAIFDGPDAPWNWVVGTGFGLVALLAGGGYLIFMDDRELDGAAPVFFLAAVALVIATLIGVDQRLLHERGRDVACRITSISEHQYAGSGGDVKSSYDYGLACDGGKPTSVDDQVVPRAQAAVGQQITLRYDPAGGAAAAATATHPDGLLALTIAAIAAGVLLVLGAITALIKA